MGPWALSRKVVFHGLCLGGWIDGLCLGRSMGCVWVGRVGR